MTTAADLITEASAQLHGWGSTQNRVTPLTANMGPTDTSFQVDFSFGQSVGITPGVVEIDSELLYVTNVDAATNTVTLANGFGRGFNGTTPAAHTAGLKVISRPRFPRSNLFKQLNEIVGSVYPDLYAVGRYTGVVTTPSNTYNLGSTIGTPMEILEAQWQDPIGNWHKCYSYSLDSFDGTFRLGAGPMVGRPLRVIYKTQPQQFTSESQDFVAQTGLPLSASDVLTLGTVAKVVVGLDISRAQLNSIEQSDRSRVVPPFAGVNVGRYLMAEFQERLANEAKSLRRQYRPRIVRTF
jgi:hypothetical protein